MKKNKIICLLLVFALALTMPAATGTAAKKKTTQKKTTQKKVALSKKTATLTVGKTLTLKVKNLKKGTKVKWSSNKKKIATVSKQGKVKAKKAGKAVITAKVGKKKLKCKITVKNKSVSKTTIASVSVLNSYTVQVTLNKAQSLAASNFTVKTKEYANGTYNRTLKIDGVTTSNKKTYTISLDTSSSIYENYYVQVTVSKLQGTGTASKQTIYSKGKFNYQDTVIYTATQGKAVDKSFWMDGFGWGTATVTGLPTGIKAKLSDSDNSIEFTGTPTKAGSFSGKITTKDELGNTINCNMTWLVGNDSTIAAAYTPSYGVIGSGSYSVWRSIHVIGGSGEYTYAIQGNNYGMEVYSGGDIEGELSAAGNYTITVEVTDKNNTSLKTTAKLSISIAAGRTISGIVKDAKGNPLDDAYVHFENKNLANQYLVSASGYTDAKGAYSVTLVDGTYDAYASDHDARSSLFSYKVTGSKSGVDFTLPLYPITVYSNNSNVSDFGNWKDDNGKYWGYGNKLYLKPGTYKLTSTFANGFIEYTAKISLTVNASTTSVTATVTEKSNIEGSITVGKPINVTSADSYKYYRFVPEETKTYYFYSEGNADTYGQLYDAQANYLNSNDDAGDGYNFLISYECTAGTTYYIGAKTYDDDFTLVVSETNPLD